MKFKDLYHLSGEYVVCYICGKQLLPYDKVSVDHDKPMARSHNNSDKNKHITHFDCNCKKGMLTMEEYKIWKVFNDVRNGKKDQTLINEVEKITLAVRQLISQNTK